MTTEARQRSRPSPYNSDMLEERGDVESGADIGQVGGSSVPSDVLVGDFFEQALCPMMLVDDERQLRAVNAAFVELLGYRRDALLRMRVEEILPRDDAIGFGDHWNALLRQGGARGQMRLLPRGEDPLIINVNTTENVLSGLHLAIVGIPHGDRCPGVPLLQPLGNTVASEEPDGLSEREQEVLWLVADGATNAQIAYGLGIVEKTVQKHVASIKHKLGASTRAQVVSLALRDGIPDAAMMRERTIIHQAIRDDAGEVVDSTIRYISHDSVHSLPGIERVLGTPVSGWYAGWTGELTFKLFVSAIKTGREGRFSGHLMRLPWESGPRAVEGRVARLDTDRAAFVTSKTSPPIV